MVEIEKFDKIITGNWKLNGSMSLVKSVIHQIKINSSNIDRSCIIICPPATYLKSFDKSPFYLGSQDCSLFDIGAYTGEISAKILNEIGCDFCLVGHSERRHFFNEDNQMVLKKTNNCLKNSIIPILCVGETLEDKIQNKTKEILKKQITECLPLITNSKNIIVAYEPIWAIGKGETPTLEEINEIHRFIKLEIFNSSDYKVIYGGSVNSTNSREILDLDEVNGLLVGGASLNIEEFNKIIAS